MARIAYPAPYAFAGAAPMAPAHYPNGHYPDGFTMAQPVYDPNQQMQMMQQQMQQMQQMQPTYGYDPMQPGMPPYM